MAMNKIEFFIFKELTKENAKRFYDFHTNKLLIYDEETLETKKIDDENIACCVYFVFNV